MDGEERHIRHGIGGRDVFGRYRVHSVTWVEGHPLVEGVESDDFERSGALLSLIKVTKKHVRPGDKIPTGYAKFTVAVMADEVRGPRSPRSMAIKLQQDDIDGWTRHALLRAAAWDRLGTRQPDRVSLPPPSAAGPLPSAAHIGGGAADQQAAVVKALLAYGAYHPPPPKGTAVAFTPNPAANELLRVNAFAFLCAVIFDQGVPAERAWLAPYILLQRLGHLHPQTMAENEGAVRDAIQRSPKLHRYVTKMPRWVVLAARRVVTTYGGDAHKIWSDEPTADELQRRLDDFVGIGQKKAAMAVEILERDLGVRVRNLERSDVAYDVHVRRVFLRTRLADRDDADHIIDVARQLNPTRPGALDLPAWLIGRGWCHAGIPDCSPCPLTEVCAKDIERAAHVTSG